MRVEKLIYNVWFILLVNACVFALMAWLLPIRFEENDDVMMCLIANGRFSGSPDGHLVFVNAIYGWIIACLYLLANAVEWYTLSFCVIHVFAMTGIVYVLLKDCRISVTLKGLFLVFMYVIWARIIMSFQFTTTAGLLCFSGCLALLYFSPKWRTIGLVAIFLASLIRFSAAALVGAIFAPLLLADCFKNRRLVCWLVSVVLLVLVGKWMDGQFYKSPDWTSYISYNTVRGYINDNPNAELANFDLPEGITLEDYQWFCWFQGDPEVMTLPKLLEIESTIKNNMSFRKVLLNCSNLLMFRIPIGILLIGCLVVAFSNCIRFRQSNSYIMSFVILAFSSLFFFSFSFYISATHFLKNRVFICLLLPIMYIMIKSFPCDYCYKRHVWLLLIMQVVVLGMVYKYVKQDVVTVRQVRSEIEDYRNYQFPLVNNSEECICLSAMKVEIMNPFKIMDFTINKVGMGWLSMIPFQKGKFESYADFIYSDILYFGKAQAPPEHILKGIERNYRMKVKMSAVEQNEKYALYRFVLD